MLDSFEQENGPMNAKHMKRIAVRKILTNAPNHLPWNWREMNSFGAKAHPPLSACFRVNTDDHAPVDSVVYPGLRVAPRKRKYD